jgi:hypothetical protein
MKPKEYKRSNPVAKNTNEFNKAATHRDKKSDYSRKDKKWKNLIVETPQHNQ